jgi:hypothetical protein
MLEIPDRAELTVACKLGNRILKKSKDPDIRTVVKAFLALVEGLDAYVNDLYPCFDAVETEIRFNGSEIRLLDGVFQVYNPVTGDVLITGHTLKDLFINYLLWKTDWVPQVELEEAATEEDEALEK